MSKILVVLFAALAVTVEAQSFHRSFRGGYPAGSGGSRVQRQGALSEKSVGNLLGNGSGSERTVTRTKTIRVVKADGDFAVEVAKGVPLYVEVEEPAGCRWYAPPSSSAFSAMVERGGAARARTKNAAGRPGTAVVTLRRLASKDVDLELKLRKKDAPRNAPPEQTMTIRLCVPGARQKAEQAKPEGQPGK